MLAWEVTVCLEWMSKSMEHDILLTQEGPHRTAISDFAGEYAIISLKDKLPCFDRSASSMVS